MKKQFVVVSDHTLGIIDPARPHVIEKLSCSILRGAVYGSQYDTICAPFPDMRPATRQDFEAFSVHSGGYEADPRYAFPTA